MRTLCLLALMACTPPEDDTPTDGDTPSVDDTPSVEDTLDATPTDPAVITIDDSPVSISMPQTCPPEQPFCSEAEGAGLHVRGPAYGRGAAWVDVDGDGWEDIWQSNDLQPGLPGDLQPTLWHNQGDGTFVPLELGISEDHTLNNWSGAWGDIDNDGDPDLYLVNGGYGGVRASRMYRNDLDTDGQFTDITAAAGLTLDEHNWWGASFADYDNDGWLDVVLVARHQLPPRHIDSTLGPTLLYRNNGDGTFADVSEAMGVTTVTGDHKNPVWADVNDDGWPDLFLASIHNPRLLINNEGGGFTSADGILPSAPVFAAAAADFNQDGIDDVYLGRVFEQELIILGERTTNFEILDEDNGLVTLSGENTMGLVVGDITTSGWPDILVGTGGQGFSENPVLFCNEPPRFQRCSDHGIIGPLTATRHHGAAIADFDHDGDNDFFWNVGGSTLWDATTAEDSREPSRLMVRHAPMENRTATVHLIGTESNRSAVGAHLRVEGSEVHHYAVRSAMGFQSQNSDWITVNLGSAEEAALEVVWPSGIVTELTIPAGSRVEIVEGI